MKYYKTVTCTAVLTLLLQACGGGSGAQQAGTDSSASTTATAVTTAPDGQIGEAAPALGASNPTDIPADALLFSDSSASAEVAGEDGTKAALGVSDSTTLLVADGTSIASSDFEGTFTTFAPGWSVNYWGTTKSVFSGGKETSAANVLNGRGSQRFKLTTVPADGGVHLIYSYGFLKDHTYAASINLKADATTDVEVQLRRNSSPYTVISSKRVSVGGLWQKVDLQGLWTSNDTGALRIIPLKTGTQLYLDDMRIAEVKSVAATPAVATAAEATPVVSGGIDLPAAGGRSVDVVPVRTTNMDSAFVRFDPSWYFNSFGGTAQADFVASRDTRPGYFYTGASSQKFQILDKKGGDVQLISGYPFVKGKTYRTTLYVKSDVSTPVQVFMRVDAHPYTPVASAKVIANSAWQKVEIEGAYVGDAAGSIRVAILNPTGTVWVDDMTIAEVKKNDMAPVSTAPVPDTLFGMHVSKLGVHSKWPGLGTKTLRLWNAGLTWLDLEKAKGSWDFRRMDMYISYALANNPGGAILYTMGQTPRWASSTPSITNAYGLGAGGAPTNMDDWRDYVRTLARRYAGKIRYWELWNEADYVGTYNGTMAQLVEMARIAHEELKSVDPANVLVSPSFTTGQGMPALDNFLASGGGAYVDAIGFHWYYSTNPESIGSSMDNVRTLMKAYGVDSKPLWNTEGAFICNPAAMDCSTATPTAAQSRSVNARAMFMMAVKGIANFNFHIWEATDPWRKLVEADYTTPTDAAKTFAEARSWLSGASVIDAYRIDDKVYAIRLMRGSVTQVVLWSTSDSQLVNLPAAWAVTQMRTLNGVDQEVPSSHQITLTQEPILLKP